MGESIFIGILTGIISGAYTGLILSKYVLFTSLRRETLKLSGGLIISMEKDTQIMSRYLN